MLLFLPSCLDRRDVVFHGDQGHLIMSVLWFQRCAEMRALFLQGYNLADHDDLFYSRDVSDCGFRYVDSLASLFGSRYIVFPNPMYGTWVNAAQAEGDDFSHRERYTVPMRTF